MAHTKAACVVRIGQSYLRSRMYHDHVAQVVDCSLDKVGYGTDVGFLARASQVTFA